MECLERRLLPSVARLGVVLVCVPIGLAYSPTGRTWRRYTGPAKGRGRPLAGPGRSRPRGGGGPHFRLNKSDTKDG